MNQVWYKTKRYSPKIEPVSVVKNTEKTVTLAPTQYFRERRADRMGQYEQYWRTWEDAHAYLVGRSEGELTSARRALQAAQDFHGNVKGMKKPEHLSE